MRVPTCTIEFAEASASNIAITEFEHAMERRIGPNHAQVCVEHYDAFPSALEQSIDISFGLSNSAIQQADVPEFRYPFAMEPRKFR